ncbi:hypothetical protein TNCV_3723291 [Trichonephila clavipes]|nr:hypothetical protein TNCV_3723291 [Trichonephila clavipes]
MRGVFQISGLQLHLDSSAKSTNSHCYVVQKKRVARHKGAPTYQWFQGHWSCCIDMCTVKGERGSAPKRSYGRRAPIRSAPFLSTSHQRTHLDMFGCCHRKDPQLLTINN